MTTEEILSIDRSHIWHPTTQHKTARLPLVFERAKGALIWDKEGKTYIDGIASWWANPHGHSHPAIIEALYQQVQTLDHVLFADVVHEPAARLTQSLMQTLPSNQSKVFFSDNGSTAVEVALKMAMQTFVNRGEVRTKIIALEDGYHGDTLGAMSASGVSAFTQAFTDILPEVHRIPRPTSDNIEDVCSQLETILRGGDSFAFIFEPIVQGAAGMRMYEAQYLDRLIKICRSYGVYTIADEVMTGFRKLGTYWASDALAVPPDFMCISKALTSGVLPLSVTTTTAEVFESFYSTDVNKAFLHGHTYTANPLGCAVANASIALTAHPNCVAHVERISRMHRQFADRIESMYRDYVYNVRQKGVILAFEIKTSGDTTFYGGIRNVLYNYFLESGILLRPLSNTVYVLPPYVITNEELSQIYEVIEGAFRLEEIQRGVAALG